MRVVGELEFGRLGKLEEVPCAEIQVPKLRGAAFSNLCRFNIQQLSFIRQNTYCLQSLTAQQISLCYYCTQ